MAFDNLDRRKTIEDYFPEFLNRSKEYRVFIKLAAEEMGLVSDYIELFTDLANVERTPEQFVKSLGEMVGYSFIDEVDPNVQREIIKRIFNKHEARGDEESMIMMASHALNNGYLGGDLFIPGTYIEGQEAVISFPRDIMYTWNHSKRSGYDKYPDGYSSVDGVIEILIGYFDENVRTRVETVKPAGVRLLFRMNVTFGTDLVKVRIPLIFTNIGVWLYVTADGRKNSKFGYNARSGASKLIRWSGYNRLWTDISPELKIYLEHWNLTGSILPEFTNQTEEEIKENNSTIDFERERSYTGLPRWSQSFTRSGKFNWSGMTGYGVSRLIEMKASHRHEMNPDNNYILLSDVADKPISGYYSPEGLNPVASVEIIQERITEGG